MEHREQSKFEGFVFFCIAPFRFNFFFPNTSYPKKPLMSIDKSIHKVVNLWRKVHLDHINCQSIRAITFLMTRNLTFARQVSLSLDSTGSMPNLGFILPYLVNAK